MIRVFTRSFAYTITIPGAGTLIDTVQVYKAEEDMWLIGAYITSHPPAGSGFIANDGVAFAEFTLTPNVVGGQPGDIYFGYMTSEVWNTAPAAVHMQMQTKVVMFPKSYGIPIKEEGVLNLRIGSYNSSAADVRLTCDVVLYLVRGKVLA